METALSVGGNKLSELNVPLTVLVLGVFDRIWIKLPIHCTPDEFWVFQGFCLKDSLRNIHSRQSSNQLECWLPPPAEIAFHGFANHICELAFPAPPIPPWPCKYQVCNPKNTAAFWILAASPLFLGREWITLISGAAPGWHLQKSPSWAGFQPGTALEE